MQSNVGGVAPACACGLATTATDHLRMAVKPAARFRNRELRGSGSPIMPGLAVHIETPKRQETCNRWDSRDWQYTPSRKISHRKMLSIRFPVRLMGDRAALAHHEGSKRRIHRRQHKHKEQHVRRMVKCVIRALPTDLET